MPERDARRVLLARILAEKAARPLKVPASTGQERLWFAMRSAPGSPVYNCPLTLEIGGVVDAEALGSALAALVHRHEALRTTFVEEEGELFQVVAPLGDLPLERVSVRSREEALERAKCFARMPFDLIRGPLYRAALATWGANESLLLLNCHHLVSDGWSQGILLRELLALYRAFTLQEKAVLDPLPVSYADFARWQRNRGIAPKERAEWARSLEDLEPLRLTADFARPPLPTFGGARVSVRIPAASARAVASRDGASLYQVVLAAFQMLLSRWCQQERFAVGTPAHNRERAEVEGVVGFFVATVPVRADFTGNPTLREALGRVRRNTLEALSRADVPFEDLVALSRRAPSVPPLVQALFVWQESLIPALDLGGVRVRAREEETGTSKFDLTLSLRPEEDFLEGHVELNTDLFHPKSVEWMIDRLEPVLLAMHRTPDAPLSSLALGAGAPLELSLGPVLSASNDTAGSYARILHLFPNEPAVDSKARRLTFAELDVAASALAARWRARGHEDGNPVALQLPTGPEAVVAIVAAWKLRSPYVPLDPGWPEGRVERILSATGASVHLRELDCGFEELLDPRAERVSPGSLPLDPSDLAYVIYTSGSTGEPKGVMVSHRSLAHLDRALESALYGAAGRRLRVGIFASLAFDTTVKQIVRLLRGDCLCPVPQELKTSPARLVSHLREADLDVVDMTPSWVRVLLDAGLAPPMPGTFLLGGEPIDGALWHDLSMRQARGEARFVNVYGPTEATVDATMAKLDLESEPSIGTPLPNTRVWLLDAESRPVPPGFAGEMAIAGDGVADGYWNRPEETARAFGEIFVEGRKERVYRTGDYARFRGDGQLVFLGRRDRQIKRHGQRVELDEVEAVLRAQAGIAGAAVVEAEGKIVAWCASRGKAPSDLPERAARALPRAFLPDEYRFCSGLPRNTSGKIDYKALADSSRSVSPRTGSEAPSLHGEHQQAIAEVWTELLGSPPAHSRANFFEAGGDSLLGLRLLARIEKRFGIELDVSTLALSPTPETLAAALVSQSPREPVIWFRRGAPWRTPVVFLHATGGDVASYRHLSSLLPGELPVAGVPAPTRLPESLRELAAHHAGSIERALPGNHAVLAGWSLGGVVAIETARFLRKRGFRVPLILLLDSRLPSGEAPIDDSLPETSQVLLRLWQVHRLDSYDGDALLIRAVLDGEESQADLWRGLLPRLVVVPSRLTHQEMMRPPQVARVAQIVERALHGVRAQ